MAVGYLFFTVKLSIVFKSYFTATWVACATRVKRLTRFLARHGLEAGRKLPHMHVRMSWNATDVRRTRQRAIPLAMTRKKKLACLLVWVWGSTGRGLRPQRSSAWKLYFREQSSDNLGTFFFTNKDKRTNSIIKNLENTLSTGQERRYTWAKIKINFEVSERWKSWYVFAFTARWEITVHVTIKMFFIQRKLTGSQTGHLERLIFRFEFSSILILFHIIFFKLKIFYIWKYRTLSLR